MEDHASMNGTVFKPEEWPQRGAKPIHKKESELNHSWPLIRHSCQTQKIGV
jgi:hypothetical protein